jgi:hypothetical protein
MTHTFDSYPKLHFVLKDKQKRQGYVLSSKGESTATISSKKTSELSSSREEEIRQVRLRQQEIANQRAKEALKLRKEKEAAEKERRNSVIIQKHLNGGRRIDGVGESKDSSGANESNNDNSGGGYNPLQPWTANSSGYR